MRLNRFRVANHSRLQDCEIEVRANLILVGPNDVGKTSVLRLLDLVLGTTSAGLYSRLDAEDFRDRNATLVVEVDLCNFDDQEKGLFPDEIDVQPGSSASLTIRLEADVDEGGTLQVHRSAPLGRTGRQLSREQIRGVGWRLVQSNQTAARGFSNERNASLQTILAEIDLGSERDLFAGILADFESHLAGSAVLGGLRSELARHLSRAIPEKLEGDDLAFANTTTAKDPLADVSLYIKRSGDDVKSMDEQSDGTKALFAVALYDFLSGSANVVAIDEPEVHLHPTSQRTIARLLFAGSNQKVLATHSSDVVGVFPPDQIVAVRPRGHLVQPRRDFLSSDDKLLVHWWVRDRLEPLTARRIVLVEGIADRIVLARVAELIGFDLDRLGISVIELNGAGAVADVRKLFGADGFQVPLSYLIDGDAVKETADKLGVAENQFKENSIFVCRRDLEAEYCRAVDVGSFHAALRSAFNENEMANCQSTGPQDTFTATDLEGFCRKGRRKVRAAIALSSILESSTASLIKPLVELLRAATT